MLLTLFYSIRLSRPRNYYILPFALIYDRHNDIKNATSKPSLIDLVIRSPFYLPQISRDSRAQYFEPSQGLMMTELFYLLTNSLSEQRFSSYKRFQSYTPLYF